MYWRVSRERFDEMDRDNRIWWGKDGSAIPQTKRFLSELAWPEATPKHETCVACLGRVSTCHGRLKSALQHAIRGGCGRCFTLKTSSRWIGTMRYTSAFAA